MFQTPEYTIWIQSIYRTSFQKKVKSPDGDFSEEVLRLALILAMLTLSKTLFKSLSVISFLGGLH
ncbi:hypothetical protein LEP1GSC127_3771 [Leptospira kirschneri str. 200801925]|nr:hypothetical protein LEP1GSC127_3771 [Leptospira kirschneri str. 200801925]